MQLPIWQRWKQMEGNETREWKGIGFCCIAKSIIVVDVLILRNHRSFSTAPSSWCKNSQFQDHSMPNHCTVKLVNKATNRISPLLLLMTLMYIMCIRNLHVYSCRPEICYLGWWWWFFCNAIPCINMRLIISCCLKFRHWMKRHINIKIVHSNTKHVHKHMCNTYIATISKSVHTKRSV